MIKNSIKFESVSNGPGETYCIKKKKGADMRFRVINISVVGFIFLIFGICTSATGAELEWQIEKKIELESPAIDMALSLDGQRAFLLDKKGNLNVYKVDGALEGTIPVGKEFDHIQPGPSPELIFISNRKKKTIDLLTIDFVQDINIEGAPFKGPENAPVVLSLFTDFQCPYCAQVGPQLEEILKDFPKEVKLVYKNFPLRNHRYAVEAAKAAMAAHKMGKFWEFHDLLFKNYNKLSKEKIDEIREELKLDKEEFEKYVKDPKTMQTIANDYQNGVDAGVRGTPSLFLNGKLVKNRRPEALKTSIEAELKKLESKK
jgi:predicted DsbA family dithiol-disulfide isomerase